jgi:hypothetical protein
MLSRLMTALRTLLRRTQAEHELDEEFRFHIDRQTEQNIRLGMSPEEARYAARKAFGGVEQAKERSRDARGVRWLEDFWQDLRYGARMLLASPSFTLIAVFTLGLGVGANTTIFSAMESLILHPFALPNQNRLVVIMELSFQGIVTPPFKRGAYTLSERHLRHCEGARRPPRPRQGYPPIWERHPVGKG